MVYRVQLTYDEFIDIFDLKYIPTTSIGYTLLPGKYDFIDTDYLSKSLLPKELKKIITFDDIGLKLSLTTIKTMKFSKKQSFTLLGFIESRSGELCVIPGFIQLIPGSYKSDKPVNIPGIDKVHLKCGCIQGSLVNGTREPILYSFALSSPPGHKIYKKPIIKLLKKLNKPLLSQITFYLEDNDHKLCDVNGETISFTCQLNKV